MGGWGRHQADFLLFLYFFWKKYLLKTHEIALRQTFCFQILGEGTLLRKHRGQFGDWNFKALWKSHLATVR